MSNLSKGAVETAIDFIPSLCHSTYGLGEALWAINAFNSQSTENIDKFNNSCYELAESFIEYCKNVDWNTIEGYTEQIKTLYEQYHQLNNTQKGELIGYSIGRYGVEVLSGGILAKGVSSFQKVKKLNQLCNLEAMTLSQAQKQSILSSALKHATERDGYFKNIKIHWDRQNKHTIGSHNFEPGKGIISINTFELEDLVKKHAGQGSRVCRSIGEAGYKERIYFGKVIGKYALKIEGKPTEFIPTTKAIVHYDKYGNFHIIPSAPSAVID